jgi:hypothetical protein
MSKQQTSVEWFFAYMDKNRYFIGNDLLDAYKKAKEMEKQQIIMAYHNGYSDAIQAEPKQYEPQQYYNETYGNEA